jgi:fumarylpyruvate hydrolase
VLHVDLRLAPQPELSNPPLMMPGDIIYAGTPENVGPVVRGDLIECHIDGLPNLGIKIV